MRPSSEACCGISALPVSYSRGRGALRWLSLLVSATRGLPASAFTRRLPTAHADDKGLMHPLRQAKMIGAYGHRKSAKQGIPFLLWRPC